MVTSRPSSGSGGSSRSESGSDESSSSSGPSSVAALNYAETARSGFGGGARYTSARNGYKASAASSALHVGLATQATVHQDRTAGQRSPRVRVRSQRTPFTPLHDKNQVGNADGEDQDASTSKKHDFHPDLDTAMPTKRACLSEGSHSVQDSNGNVVATIAPAVDIKGPLREAMSPELRDKVNSEMDKQAAARTYVPDVNTPAMRLVLQSRGDEFDFLDSTPDAPRDFSHLKRNPRV